MLLSESVFLHQILGKCLGPSKMLHSFWSEHTSVPFLLSTSTIPLPVDLRSHYYQVNRLSLAKSAFFQNPLHRYPRICNSALPAFPVHSIIHLLSAFRYFQQIACSSTPPRNTYFHIYPPKSRHWRSLFTALKNDPLSLFHDTSLQYLRISPVCTSTAFLKQDRTGVYSLHHIVDRSACNLYTSCQSCSWTFKP